jgi:hypothetical protein
MNETITWLQFKDLLSVAAPLLGAAAWILTSYKSDKVHLQSQIDKLAEELRALQLSVAQTSVTKEDFNRFEERVLSAIKDLHGRVSAVREQK